MERSELKQRMGILAGKPAVYAGRGNHPNNHNQLVLGQSLTNLSKQRKKVLENTAMGGSPVQITCLTLAMED